MRSFRLTDDGRTTHRAAVLGRAEGLVHGGAPAPRTGASWFDVCLLALLAAVAPVRIEASEEGSAPVTVTVAQARSVDVSHEVVLPGQLEPFERVMVFAKVTGYIAEISVDIGGRVKKDQVLVRLSVPEMEPQLALAKANVEVSKVDVESAKTAVAVARADVEVAKSNFTKATSDRDLKSVTHKRLVELQAAEKGAVSQQDIDVAEAELRTAEALIGVSKAQATAAESRVTAAQSRVKAAEAGVVAAEAEVARLQTMLDYATIHAPFDGTVTRRLLDTGALVGAANGKPILELVRDGRLRLAFDVPERLLSCLSSSQAVTYSLEAIPFKAFEGAVARKSGTVSAQTRSMRLEVDADNAAGQLAPGMYAKVRLPCSKMQNVMAVPLSAVRSSRGETAVFSMEGGQVKRHPVIVVVDDGKDMVVCGDITGQTLVVTKSSAPLKDGERVTLQQ
jgi:RND family efflux transporter MFP subunit